MPKDSTNGNGNGNGYPIEVWQKVEHEYQLGQLSVAAISRAYGPSRAAIEKRMKRRGITRHLAADIKNSVDHKIIEAELEQQVTADNYDEAVEQYGQVGAGVVGAHKVLFNKILQQVGVTCDDLKASQVILNKLAAGDTVKKNMLMAAKLALQERDKMLRTVAYVVDKIVPLQRQAFGLDSEGSTAEKITYIIVGDLDKPRDAGMGSAKRALNPGTHTPGQVPIGQ